MAAVLFDLDGTLLDSAPDLAGTANDMRLARGLAQLPYVLLRPHAGSGARGMLGAALDVVPAQAAYASHRDEFHDRYEARMLQLTTAFDGVAALILALQQHGMCWGIVTNKALRFAVPLVQAFPVLAGHQVLVGGDSTPQTKPHPAPLLEAARRVGCAAASCLYIGDDHRDMLAARAAGMGAIAAAWGYTGSAAPIEDWGADHVLQEPLQLLQTLNLT
ncbi:MAG: phosphoglycolate phosphatase [Rubrivivax sp.]|nr:phosphoglycolate phosphatase [Rubrivivax sp.]